jgi:hypothetical protein
MGVATHNNDKSNFRMRGNVVLALLLLAFIAPCQTSRADDPIDMGGTPPIYKSPVGQPKGRDLPEGRSGSLDDDEPKPKRKKPPAPLHHNMEVTASRLCKADIWIIELAEFRPIGAQCELISPLGQQLIGKVVPK